jgi:hypothetical protein
MTRIHLTEHERDVLYRAVVLDLSGLSDVYKLLEDNQGAKAREHRERFEDDWALLDAIGWEADDEREQFELIPNERIVRALCWLEGQATGCLETTPDDLREPYRPDFHGTPEDFGEILQERRDWADENLDLRSACRRVLEAS